MKISTGIITSNIDFPGHISSVIFTLGCNFNCEYCHNRILLTEPSKFLSSKGCLQELNSTRKFCDGVVITGGEPTIHKDLPELIQGIKDLGFLVKLDTNGSNPDMIKTLIDKNLIDYIAMDVKAPLSRYADITGAIVNTADIERSIRLIRTSGIDYEFRTTIEPNLSMEDYQSIICLVDFARRFALQKYRSPDLKVPPAPTIWENIEQLKILATQHVREVILRP